MEACGGIWQKEVLAGFFAAEWRRREAVEPPISKACGRAVDPREGGRDGKTQAPGGCAPAAADRRRRTNTTVLETEANVVGGCNLRDYGAHEFNDRKPKGNDCRGTRRASTRGRRPSLTRGVRSGTGAEREIC